MVGCFGGGGGGASGAERGGGTGGGGARATDGPNSTEEGVLPAGCFRFQQEELPLPRNRNRWEGVKKQTSPKTAVYLESPERDSHVGQMDDQRMGC